MNKVFTDNGWKDYVYWQTEDRKTLKKINSLIDDVCRNGNEGNCSTCFSLTGAKCAACAECRAKKCSVESKSRVKKCTIKQKTRVKKCDVSLKSPCKKCILSCKEHSFTHSGIWRNPAGIQR